MAEPQEQIFIRNEVEAALMESILENEGIPHFIKSFHDRAYDGIWQFQNGWGRIEAPAQYRSGIKALLLLLRNNRTLPRITME